MKDLPIKNRHIRIFISSTFRDMQAERDYLIKYTFPELRKRCRERGLELTEVDLRWGVTEEQADNGQVLPICLNEIENTRPYFIGLLGERYGWVPNKENIPPHLLKTEKWIGKNLDKSVTEMEILHGVLNNPDMASNAYFYFRDPEYTKTIEENERVDYHENDPILKKKLETLKSIIRKSGFNLEENYRNVEELDKYVLDDLWKAIELDYPNTTTESPEEIEDAAHVSFSESFKQVYIKKQYAFQKLTKYVAKDGLPMVVKAPSGTGKTALLANWANYIKNKYPFYVVIEHYIGASTISGLSIQILKRLIRKLDEKLHIIDEIYNKDNQKFTIPDNETELISLFRKCLEIASSKKDIILVIDNINANYIHWLPYFFPKRCRVVVSVAQYKAEDLFKDRKWKKLQLNPFTIDERKKYIFKYLAQYTKCLDHFYLDKIANAKQCENPLFLRTLLDDLKVFGSYESLGDQIERYLTANDLKELFVQIIERYEMDYDTDEYKIVKKTLCYLWGARIGLRENDFINILSSEVSKLPQVIFSPLFLALQKHLNLCFDNYQFLNNELRDAIKAKYLHKRKSVIRLHATLAKYFKTHPDFSVKVMEYPWQLMYAKNYDQLYEVLDNDEFLKEVIKIDDVEVINKWLPIFIKYSKSTRENFIDKADLFYNEKRYEQAYRLYQKVEIIDRNNNDKKKLEITLFDLGYITRNLKKNKKSTSYFKEQEVLCRELRNKESLQVCLGNIAYNYSKYKNPNYKKRALLLYKEQQQLCLELKDEMSLIKSLNSQWWFVSKKSKNEEFEMFLNRVEQIHKTLKNEQSLISSLEIQIDILKDLEENERAIILLKEQEKLCIKLEDNSKLEECLENQADILSKMENYESALDLCKRREIICKNESYSRQLLRCLVEQASIYKKIHKEDQLIEIYKELELLLRKSNDKWSLAINLENQADIIVEEQPIVAYKLYKESETLYREQNSMYSVLTCINSQAVILRNMGQIQEAAELYERNLQILIILNNTEIIIDNLDELAELYKESYFLDKAIDKLILLEKYCLVQKDMDKLQYCYGDMGDVYKSIKDYKNALRCYKKQENICRNSGLEFLRYALFEQSEIYKNKGQVDFALEVLLEHEQICRNSIDDSFFKRSLSYNLQSQTEICISKGKWDEALMKSHEQEKICRELNNTHGLQKCIYNILQILNVFQEKELYEYYQQQYVDILRSLIVAQGNLIQDHIKDRNLFQAMQVLTQFKVLCYQSNNPQYKSNYLREAITVYIKIKNYNEALEKCDVCEQICISLNDQDGIVECLNAKAFILQQLNRMEDALKVYIRLQEIIENADNKCELRHNLIDMSEVLYNLHKNEEALNLLFKLEKHYRKINNQELLQDVLNHIAYGYYKLGIKLQEALSFLKEQEVMCKNNQWQKELISCYQIQALILHKLESWEEALLIHDKEEVLCNELEDTASLLTSYNNRAEVYLQTNILDEAQIYYNKIIDVASNENRWFHYLMALGNTALVFYKKNKLYKAFTTVQILEKESVNKNTPIHFDFKKHIVKIKSEYNDLLK